MYRSTSDSDEASTSFCYLPEISEEALENELTNAGIQDPGPFYKQWRCLSGFFAQTAYVCVELLHLD